MNNNKLYHEGLMEYWGFYSSDMKEDLEDELFDNPDQVVIIDTIERTEMSLQEYINTRPWEL